MYLSLAMYKQPGFYEKNKNSVSYITLIYFYA